MVVMKDPIILYKRQGETPLACMERYRATHPELAGVSMTYAGRLDPLAEGVLLVLAGETVHEKESYLKLDKEYVVKVLFGFATDTHDLLGMVVEMAGRGGISEPRPAPLTREALLPFLQTFVGPRLQKYPRFSSKTFLGKPLFAWARGAGIADADIPEREVIIHSIDLLDLEEISVPDMRGYIEKAIASVQGDFRQEAILRRWGEVLEVTSGTYTIATIRVVSSSGTYMRTLAHEIGQKLGLPALAFHIFRTKVGPYRAIY